MSRPLFIVLEGADGAGKTEQTRRLVAWLLSLGRPVQAMREPTNGPVGMVIRDFLAHRVDLGPDALPLLFAADRKDHVSRGIAPALAAGTTVVCDRYSLSNRVYRAAETAGTLLTCQACGWHGEPVEQPEHLARCGFGDTCSGWSDAAEERAAWTAQLDDGLGGILRPDLTVVLSVTPEVCAQRRAARGLPPEAYDDSVRQGRCCWLYDHADELLNPGGPVDKLLRTPVPVAVVDGNASPGMVELLVREAVQPLLGGA